MNKNRFLLFLVGWLSGMMVLIAQVPVTSYRFMAELEAPSRPTEWTDFTLKSMSDTIGGKWLSLDTTPVKMPTYGRPLSLETQPIGFDFLFAGQKKTYFGLTGNGLVYLRTQKDTSLLYSGLVNPNIVDVISVTPRIFKGGRATDPTVSSDEYTHIGYYSDMLNGILTIRFENLVLRDGLTENTYRWSYDLILYQGGKISVLFRDLEFPEESSVNQFGFTFAIKAKGSQVLYAADWISETTESDIALEMNLENPGEGALVSFTYPLECEPPTSLLVEMEKGKELSTSFSGKISPVGEFDGLLILLSTADDLDGFPASDYNLPQGKYLYEVEAFYNNSCTASDSVEVSLTQEGLAMPPSGFSLQQIQQNGSAFDVEAQWNLPFFENPLSIGYGGMPYSGTSLAGAAPMWCLIGWDSAALDPYRDLYIVGMEFFIGEGITNVEGLVYLNDTMALRMPMSSRVKENEWNTLMFNQYIPMDQPMEALVGYRVEYSDKTLPVAVFDMGPAVTGYGDLLSTDGQQWSTLTASGLSANWCINALVVRKRDMEKAAMLGLEKIDNPLVKTMRLGRVGLAEPQAVASPKATSESVKLQGFNIYRDDVKLNTEMLTSLSYVDSAVPEGSYEYYVSAVYSEGEIAGDPILIDVDNVVNENGNGTCALVMTPNPASDYVRIEGTYSRLDVMALSGQVVASFTHAELIPVDTWVSGLYLCRFTMPDGSVEVQKLLILR